MPVPLCPLSLVSSSNSPVNVGQLQAVPNCVSAGISPTKFAEPVQPLTPILIGMALPVIVTGKMDSLARGGEQIVYSKSQVALPHLPLR